MASTVGPLTPGSHWAWYKCPEGWQKVNLGPLVGAIIAVKGNVYQIHFGGILLGTVPSWGIPFTYAQNLIAKAAGDAFNATIK